MFGRKAREEAKRMRELRGEIAVLTDRLSQLRHTRIRYSIRTDLGIAPIWDVELEYAIMLTNMHGGNGRALPSGQLEIISQYTPLMVTEPGDEDYDADDLRPWN
jgi:hypothetical protein